MISYVKQLLKRSRLSHALAKRTRNFFQPHLHLPDLSAAWNEQFYLGDNPDLCFSLYKKNRDFQKELAAKTIKPSALPRRYLGPEWVRNIGTLAHLDTYAKIGLLGWRPPQESLLTVYPGLIGNVFLLGLWKKYFSVVDDADALRKAAREILILMDYHLMMEVKERAYVFPQAAAVVQQEWEAQRRAPLLQLDEATIERGYGALAELGMPRDAWFVALHVRENGYKTDEIARCVRNSHIESYFPALRRIVAAGGWVIRLGDPSMTPLPRMEGVVDYAFSPMRRDWMDIFLASQCRFLIGCQSGISHVGDIFGVPTLYANWASWGYWPWFNTNVILPKVVWSRQRQRPLSLREILHAGLGWCQNADAFTSRQIDIFDNTPENLEAGVEEMLNATANGRWGPGPEQAAVRKHCADRGLILNGRVSNAFLNRYSSVFDD